MKYALDTNIVTYYLKGNEEITGRVDKEAENDNIIIPPFVYFEIKKWLSVINSKNKLASFSGEKKQHSKVFRGTQNSIPWIHSLPIS